MLDDPRIFMTKARLEHVQRCRFFVDEGLGGTLGLFVEDETKGGMRASFYKELPRTLELVLAHATYDTIMESLLWSKVHKKAFVAEALHWFGHAKLAACCPGDQGPPHWKLVTHPKIKEAWCLRHPDDLATSLECLGALLSELIGHATLPLGLWIKTYQGWHWSRSRRLCMPKYQGVECA